MPGGGAGARREAMALVRRIEDEAKETADRKAKEVLAIAIDRCSSDFVAEATVSVVALPSDDMKGRIIGRDGRNIRAFEQATGSGSGPSAASGTGRATPTTSFITPWRWLSWRP